MDGDSITIACEGKGKKVDAGRKGEQHGTNLMNEVLERSA
jgi:hypothetical protein